MKNVTFSYGTTCNPSRDIPTKSKTGGNAFSPRWTSPAVSGPGIA